MDELQNHHIIILSVIARGAGGERRISIRPLAPRLPLNANTTPPPCRVKSEGKNHQILSFPPRRAYTMSSVSLSRRKVTEVLISCQVRESNIVALRVFFVF